jgi:cytochrome c biogenesis protein CcdA
VNQIPLGGTGGRRHRPGPWRYVLLAVALALAGVAGYAGYVAFPRFDLPRAAGLGLLALAAAAGVASFFSPCSFPLLVTLMSREVRGAPSRGRAAVVFASAFSAGAAAFVTILAVLFGLGGRTLAGAITFTSPIGIAIRVTVGLLLIVLGLVQANVLPVSFHAVEGFFRPLSEAQARLRRRHPVAGAALFGLSYLLIGFG